MTKEQIKEIESRDKPADHMMIYAPMGGIVIEKFKQQGDRVNTGERIYTVADLSHLWVRMHAFESDLMWLRYGQTATFTTDAYPGEEFVGRIAFIDPVLDDRTRTVDVRVNIDNTAKSVQTAADANLLAATDPIMPSVPIELQSLYEAAGRCRPETQERLYSVMRDRRTKRLAELQYRPDITAGLGWQAITGNNARSGVANGNDNLAFTIGINVPVWRDKLRAGVCEAEQRILESSRRHDVTRDDTMRMVRRLMVQARAAEQQLELFNDSIIPKSEQALQVSTADYRVDKVDFQTIMDNWSELLMFQLQVARLESNLLQTLASLERVVGCEPATLQLPTESIPPPLWNSRRKKRMSWSNDLTRDAWAIPCSGSITRKVSTWFNIATWMRNLG